MHKESNEHREYRREQVVQGAQGEQRVQGGQGGRAVQGEHQAQGGQGVQGVQGGWGEQRAQGGQTVQGEQRVGDALKCGMRFCARIGDLAHGALRNAPCHLKNVKGIRRLEADAQLLRALRGQEASGVRGMLFATPPAEEEERCR